MRVPILLLLVAFASTSLADRSIGVRLKDGSLLRKGDSKTRLLEVWGFPDMQQGGVFWYQRGKTMYQIRFSGDEISNISKAKR